MEGKMRLNIKAFMLTSAIFWAATIFIIGVANLICPNYGTAFLQLAASVYPGYDTSCTIGSVIVGTLYAVVDGAVAGLVFAWLYNLLLGKGGPATDAN